MSFASDLARFNQKQRALAQALFANVVIAVGDSIREGSTVTGSPGQPVDTGHLKASWHTVFESATRAAVITNTVYAQAIEDGTRRGRALTLRSSVGGFHSISKTITGFDKLVAAEARALGAG